MCDKCSKAKTLDDIGLMLEEDRYEFARNTLEGIATWVCQNDHVTPGQLTAIRNIRLSVIATQKRETASVLKKSNR